MLAFILKNAKIKASEEQRLFPAGKVFFCMKIIEDLHTHTFYSHGNGSPRDNVLRAIELGLEGVAVSEHAGGNIYFGFQVDASGEYSVVTV